MEMKTRRLVLIHGGADKGQGPITRLALWHRVPTSRPAYLYLLVGTKVLVLISLLYAIRAFRG